MNYLNKEEVKKKKKRTGQSYIAMLNSYKATGFVPIGLTKENEKKIWNYVDDRCLDLWKEICWLKWDKAITWDSIDLKYYEPKDQFYQVHHLIGRAQYLTRWDSNNGIILTQGVHDSLTNYAPDKFQAWLKEKFPERFRWREENLVKAFAYNAKPSLFEIIEKRKQLQYELSEERNKKVVI